MDIASTYSTHLSNSAMIQTIAGISSAAGLPGAIGAASGQGDSPFLALLTQALGAQSGKSGATSESVFAALLGGAGAASEGQLALAAPNLEDAVPAQRDSLADLLGKGFLGGGLASLSEGTAAVDSMGKLPVDLGVLSPESPGEALLAPLAKAIRPRPKGDEDAGDASVSVDSALVAALTGAPVSATPPSQDAAAVVLPAGRDAGAVTVVAGLVAQASRADGGAAPKGLTGQPAIAVVTDGSGEETEFAGMADTEDGKKLPPSLAAFAGGEQESARARMVSIERAAPLDGMPVITLKADPAAPSPVAASPVALTDSTVVTQGGVTTPSQVAQAGHELAASAAKGTGHHVAGDKVEIHIQSNLGSPGWQREVGDRLVWLAGRQGQSAELILNPPSLGAVEVRLNLSGGEATAQFFSANPNVRDVLETALPRLREMLGSAGIALGEAMVSNQSFSRQDGARQGGSAQPDGTGFAASDDADARSDSGILSRGTSLLDYFA